MRAFDATLQAWILSYLLNSFWQVPLVYCAALAVTRIARPIGAKVEHCIWVAALLIEVALPACDVPLAGIGQRVMASLFALMQVHSTDGQVRIVAGAGSVGDMSRWWSVGPIFAVATIAYLASLLYFAGRLAWGAWTTESMRRHAVGLALDAEMTAKICLLQDSLGMPSKAVRFATSPAIAGPATVGFMRATLLLPRGFLTGLDSGDLDALLAHEFAHMHRADFAKNLLYGFLSIPVAYHPLLWLTRTRLAETRELVCDAMAADAVGGRESYARSLLRLASMLSGSGAANVVHAIGIFDANIFERRVMDLTRGTIEISGLRKAAIATACALVMFGTCGSALALRMDVNQPSPKGTAPTKITVKSESLTIMNKVTPVYPVEAKKNKVMGVVVVAAVIGKDGAIEHAHAVSGPTMLQHSAVDAVKQWKYQPYLLNGDPVAVDTKINITYSLAK